jgi:hypothetical protein
MTALSRFFLQSAVAVSLLAPSVAHANLADCGQINVDASATCEVKTGCSVSCTPISFQAACAGKLEASCETQCSQLPSATCTGSCTGDCQARCTVTPATFDCEGDCTGQCEGTCSGKCASSANQAECEASCKATCSGECHGSCTGTQGSADCVANCQASCSGSCKADLNIDCQTQCQSQGFVQCQADLEGGCKADCTGHGAIFCDGQYVDNGGHAQQCLDSLEAYLKSHVVANASGYADCSGNTCEASGKASVSCAVSPTRRSSDSSFGWGALIAAGFVVGARARKRAR